MMKKSFYLVSILAVSAMASGCGGSSDFECSTGKKKCENNTAYMCVRGYWDAGTPCTLGCAENVCAEEQVAVCSDGETKCENKMVYTCAQNSWGSGTTCEFGCNGDVCAEAADVCTIGAKKCEDNREYTCVDSRWNDGSECSDGCDGSVCKVVSHICTGEMTKCERDILYVCDNDSWKLDSVCQNGCNGDACADNAGNCIDGAKKCENNRAYVCNAGNWGAPSSCVNGCDGDVCLKVEYCGTKDDVRCKDGVAQKCDGEKWLITELCANGCTDDACTKASQDGDSCIDPETGAPAKEFCDGNYAMWCENSTWMPINCHEEFGKTGKCFAGSLGEGEDKQDVAFCYSPCSAEEKDSDKYECIEHDGRFSSVKSVCTQQEYGIYSWEETGDDVPCSAGCSNGKCDIVDEKDGSSCDPTVDTAACKGKVWLVCDPADSKWYAYDCEFELGQGAVCTDEYSSDAATKFACVQPCSESDKTMCQVNSEGQGVLWECSKYAEGKYEWLQSRICSNGCDGDACKLLDKLENTACDNQNDEDFCNGSIRLTCGAQNLWEASDCSLVSSVADNLWSSETNVTYTCGKEDCAVACTAGTPDEGFCKDDVFYSRSCKSNRSDKSTKEVYYWEVSREECLHGCNENGCIKYSESEGTACNPNRDSATCSGDAMLNCMKKSGNENESDYVWVADMCKKEGSAQTCGLFILDNEYVNSCYDACTTENAVSSVCDGNVKNNSICQYDIMGNLLWLDNGSINCEHGCQDGECKKLDPTEYTACDDAPYCQGDLLLTCEYEEAELGMVWHASACPSNQICAVVDGDSGCLETCTSANLNQHKNTCSNNAKVDYQCLESDNGKLVWSAVSEVACAHGCDNGACKKLDAIEYTACNLETDSVYCKDGKRYYCDGDDALWHVDECASGEICVEDAQFGVGCYQKCAAANTKTESCTDSLYKAKECRDNGSGQGYLVNDSYYCLNGCTSDNKACVKKDEREYSACNPNTDKAVCTNNNRVYCDSYDSRWMVDDCSYYGDTCFDSNDLGVFCGVKCSASDVATLKLTCNEDSLSGSICIEDSNGNYYLENRYTHCAHGCKNDACVMLSSKEGVRCDSETATDDCDGTYRLQCIDDIWTVNADCSMLGSGYSCSINSDKKAECRGDGKMTLNPVLIQQDDYYICSADDYAEYCDGNTAVFCWEGERVERDCETINDENSSYACAMRRDANGKNRAECIAENDADACTEAEMGQEKAHCGTTDKGAEASFNQICALFTDGKRHWSQGDISYCADVCQPGCVETVCNASSSTCNGNLLVQCGFVTNDDHENIYSVIDCAKNGMTCTVVEGESLCQ